MKLDKLTVQGYKSIRDLQDFELANLNVLIGANGAGKSNFISLFRLLAALAEENLQEYVQQQGGPDALLFRGRKHTSELVTKLTFGVGIYQGYQVALEPTADNRFLFKRESVFYHRPDHPSPYPYAESIGASHEETKLPRQALATVSSRVLRALKNWRVYHFHDTSSAAAVKMPHASNDNLRLKPDAGNLAAFLARLKNEDSSAAYQRIVDTIRLAAPFFGDFVIRDPLPRTIELEWTQKGDPDTPYRAHVLSDGTLRFLCLTTLLRQPDHLLPDTILIDEPELGLPPYAINLLAEMLKQVSLTKQVIVSTQSVELLNYFEPQDVIVVDRQEEASTFRRLNRPELEGWLEDYTLGELWKSNVIGGRPALEAVPA